MAGAAITLAAFGSPAHAARHRTHARGIRFTLPAAATLESVQLYWQRSGTDCSLALHPADANGRLGDAIETAVLPPGRGWVATSLRASLDAGATYHLVATCARAGRLATQPATADATARLESIHGDRARTHDHAAPLVVLGLAGGTWWGQPYRHGDAVRLCGGQSVRQTFVAAEQSDLTALAVPIRGGARGARVDLELDADDGGVLLASPLTHRRTGRIHTLHPTVTAPVALQPGHTYTVSLHSDAARGRCVRLTTRSIDLPLGRPLSGLALGALTVSTDDGQTWTSHPDALALALVNAIAPPDGTPPSCTGAGCQQRRYRSTYASGYFGVYDSATLAAWPQRLGVVLGEANAQGPLIAEAKRAAAAAGNGDAKFVFYFSLTSLDSQCDCFDSKFYDQLVAAHPEWVLRDAAGRPLSTFVGEIGTQRQFATDIGNPAFVDAWASWALDAMTRYGWDGVWIDNVLRGNFYGWSGTPVNPRTGAAYASGDYRRDMLRALQRLRQRLDAHGKMMIGNHAAAWEADTFADPVVRQQITTMHGVEIEDCVYNFDGAPHPEPNWIAQLRYLDFANRHGVLTQCRGGDGALERPAQREYVLASYLLTKEGLSNAGQVNRLSSWWDQLGLDLGAPRGGFTCLDPARGLAATSDCPSAGKVYQRDWEHGRVLVNPTGDRTITVPLHATFVHAGQSVTVVTLPPHSGVVLAKR